MTTSRIFVALLLAFICRINANRPKTCLPFAFQLLSTIYPDRDDVSCATACMTRHETAAEWIGEGFLGKRRTFQGAAKTLRNFWFEPCLARGIICLGSFAGYDTGASKYDALLKGLERLSCFEQFRASCPARLGLSGPTCICDSTLILERVSVFDVEYGPRGQYSCDPFEVCRRLNRFLGPVFVCNRFRALSDEPESCYPGDEAAAQHCTCNRGGKQSCRSLEWTTSNSDDFGIMSQQKLAEDGGLSLDTLIIYDDYLRYYRPSVSNKASFSLSTRFKEGLSIIDLDDMAPTPTIGCPSPPSAFTRLKPSARSNDLPRATKRKRLSRKCNTDVPMASSSPVADLDALNPRELTRGSSIASTFQSAAENPPLEAIDREQLFQASNMVELAPVTSFVELLQQQISIAASHGYIVAGSAVHDMHLLGESGFHGNLAPFPKAWPQDFASRTWLPNADQGSDISLPDDEGSTIDQIPFSNADLLGVSEAMHLKLAPAKAFNTDSQRSSLESNNAQFPNDQAAFLELPPPAASQDQIFEILSNLASVAPENLPAAARDQKNDNDRIVADEDDSMWMQEILDLYKSIP